MNVRKEIGDNKLTNLNFNLKNEIFDFLPFEDLIIQIMRVDRNFIFALKNRNSLKYIRKNMGYLLNNLEFYPCNIAGIKSILLQLELEDEYYCQIITYLLKIKYKNEYVLDLSSRDLGGNDDFSFKVISYFIKWNYKLLKLYLENNSLGVEKSNKVSYFSDALINNNTIQEIFLNENLLGNYSDNIKYLSQVISSNKTINSLYLSSNNLGNDPLNMKYLSEGLIINQSIEYLDLSLNNLGNNIQNIFFLSEIINSNNILKEIYLNDNYLALDKCNVKRLSEAIEANKSLREINLNSNNFGSDFDNIKILIRALKNNTRKFQKIKTIFLRCNGIQNNKIYEKYLEEELENEKHLVINY